VIVAGAASDRLPLVPVTVTVYVPAVVPALTPFEQATEVADPLHPLIIPKPNPSSNISTAPRSLVRPREGISRSKHPASATPPNPPRSAAAFVRQLLYGPAEVSEMVAVPAPPAASVRLPGATAHVGATAVTGDIEQLSDTVPANPLTEVPVSVHLLVVVRFAAGVTESVEGLEDRVKLAALAPPPLEVASMKSATSSDPNPVAKS